MNARGRRPRPRRQRLMLISGLVCALAVVAAQRPDLAQASRPARVLKGPYLTRLSESGVEVRFELDGPAPVAVDVGRDQALGGRAHTFEDRSRATMHVVSASGLAAATRYAYAVRVDGKAVGGGRFTTAPSRDSGAPMKFLVYGDDRTDPTAHAAVARALTAWPSDFLVNTGDMVEDGGRAEDWQSFFDIESQLLRDRALFVAIGNHELYDDRAGANFARYFGISSNSGALEPYGTVRLSNARIFFLNSSHDWTSGEERQWLERELVHSDAEPGLVWRIAVMHQGPWSSGPHGGSTLLTAARVPELLRAHRVDLLIAGHDHIYERGDSAGMKYLISGGGGAPLYRASKIASTRKSESTYHFVEITTDGEALRVLAKRLDGSILDRCGLPKGGPWDCDGPEAQGTQPADHGRGADAMLEPSEGTLAYENEALPGASRPGSRRSPPHRCACETLGARAASRGGGLLFAAAMAIAMARRAGPRG